MLVNDDDTFIKMRGSDAFIGVILDVMSDRKAAKRVADGVYEIHHFGSSNWPGGYYDWMGAYDLQENLDEDDPNRAIEWNGVCDTWEQITEKWPCIASSLDALVITVTPIVRAEQSSPGGWRWHKWGKYIGTHTPTAEYIADEPNIARVYVYHIYVKKEDMLERQKRIAKLSPEAKQSALPSIFFKE